MLLLHAPPLPVSQVIFTWEKRTLHNYIVVDAEFGASIPGCPHPEATELATEWAETGARGGAHGYGLCG